MLFFYLTYFKMNSIYFCLVFFDRMTRSIPLDCKFSKYISDSIMRDYVFLFIEIYSRV